MAKTDKSNKKAASKNAISSKKILAKAAAALAKPESSSEDSDSDSSEEATPPVKVTPTSVKPDASSSDASSSEESDTINNKGKLPAPKSAAPVKTTPAAVQKATNSSDDSSGASSSDESSSSDSDEDKEMASVPAKTSPDKGKKASNSKDHSSDESSSDESSSEDDSDDEDAKTSAPAHTAPAEANKKRRADSEIVGAPKKAKLANGSANAVTFGEETKSIFVGKLSWNVDNDWLAQEFADCGEVESAHVQMDRNTGRSRGFGYVNFKTADAVEKALALNGKEIDGRAINVDKSTPVDKKVSMEKRAQAFGDGQSPPSAVLFVGNLSFGVDEDTLWETFGEHGDVKSVRVPTDRDTGKPKGFAYVEFSEVVAAKKAHGELQGFELDGRSIRLDFSQPRDSAGGRGGGQGSRGGRGRGGFGGDRGGFGGNRGGFGGNRGGFGGDRGRGGRGGRGGDRGGRGRGRGGARTGGITHFEGQKITF